MVRARSSKTTLDGGALGDVTRLNYLGSISDEQEGVGGWGTDGDVKGRLRRARAVFLETKHMRASPNLSTSKSGSSTPLQNLSCSKA